MLIVSKADRACHLFNDHQGLCTNLEMNDRLLDVAKEGVACEADVVGKHVYAALYVQPSVCVCVRVSVLVRVCMCVCARV